jgi:hypothetical protein
MSTMVADEGDTREAGQREYAHADDNALANFDRLGELVRCHHCGRPVGPFVVILVFLLKHLDGVIAAAAGHLSQREPVQGRIKDLRVYLVLLRALFDREEARRGDVVEGSAGVSGSESGGEEDR